ncbi:IS3 family transposase [Salinicoccus kekensis]|uniref:IS3 family transposase n=1 Tax=Salinicoccus kekensis TaxID=714307 RepID=UPI000BE3FBC1
MIQSRSLVGEYIDNKPIESFFGKLKSKCYHPVSVWKTQEYHTYSQPIVDLKDYVNLYNHDRSEEVLAELISIEFHRVAT